MLWVFVDNVAPPPLGFYSGELVFFGGADADASDELARLPLQLEVVDGYPFRVEIPNPDRVAGIGQTEVYSHRYVNEGTREFVFTWIFTGFSDPSPTWLGHQFLFHNLIWQVPAGTTVETEVFSLTPQPGERLGLFRGDGGVAGGYYLGDSHHFGAPWTLTVVPEPASVAVLFGGLASLGAVARLRRKR